MDAAAHIESLHDVVDEYQAVWLGAYVSIFDAYERWRRPWWARAIAWGIAVFYAVRQVSGIVTPPWASGQTGTEEERDDVWKDGVGVSHWVADCAAGL